MILNTPPQARAHGSYAPSLLPMYLIGEGPPERFAREGLAIRECSLRRVHRRRFVKEDPSKKVCWRRSDREGPMEKVQWRRSYEEGLTEKV